MPLDEPLGFAEPQLKNTGPHGYRKLQTRVYMTIVISSFCFF